jgi:hypothetical protein
MAVITSNAGVLLINGESAICPKSITLKMDLELKDLQCSASNGYKRSAAGNVSWDGSLNMVMDSGAGFTAADAMNALKSRVVKTISLAITGGFTFTGNAFITNVTNNLPENNDAIDISVSFTGDDEPTIS